jgi:copper(I)-binding protein
MEGNTMKMAPVAEMKLEPQVPLQLAPGGYHLMLMDLKPEFAKATSVPLTLTFKDMKGEEVQKEVEVPITMNPPQAPNAAPEHMHMHM